MVGGRKQICAPCRDYVLDFCPLLTKRMNTNPITRLQASVEKARAKKRERLEKIVALAMHKGSITNNDVELLVHVTDATATRYLLELVKAGRLKRIGIRAAAKYQPV